MTGTEWKVVGMLNSIKNGLIVALIYLNQRIGRFIIKKTEKSEAYYFDQSCQIPNLSKIYEYFFPEGKGTVVEVGAFDGISYSNTSGLISKGWSALLIEPVSESYQKCKMRYAKYSKVVTLNVAVGAKKGVLEINLAGALSSGDRATQTEYSSSAWAAKHLTPSSEKVQQRSLDSILSEFPKFKYIDVLVIDVEGYEEEVMNGFSLEDSKPKMIIIELLDFHPNLISSRESHSRLRDRILRADYAIVYKDSINTIFYAN